MAIEHHFYMDTAASRHELRYALVQAGIGLQADPDWKNTSGASSAATNVTILDDLSWRSGWPDNGVVATRSFTFQDNRIYLSNPDHPEDFETQTIQGVVALLKAFPEADAYWLGWDAAVPLLLRRGGRLVLAQASAKPGSFWGAEGSPERALVDLPYAVEPLGPWDYIEEDPEFWEQLEARARGTGEVAPCQLTRSLCLEPCPQSPRLGPLRYMNQPQTGLGLVDRGAEDGPTRNGVSRTLRPRKLS